MPLTARAVGQRGENPALDEQPVTRDVGGRERKSLSEILLERVN